MNALLADTSRNYNNREFETGPVNDQSYGHASIARSEHFELVSDLEILVPVGRLCPKQSLSSRLMATTMMDIEDQAVLDIGAGTGLISLLALQRGARSVLATDIDPVCCSTCKENANRNGFSSKLSVEHADSLDISTKAKYDLIIANLPIRPYVPKDFWDNPLASEMERSLIDPGHQALKTVIGSGREFLMPGGRIRFTLADFANTESLKDFAENHGWDIKVLISGEDKKCTFQVLELTSRSRLR